MCQPSDIANLFSHTSKCISDFMFTPHHAKLTICFTCHFGELTAKVIATCHRRVHAVGAYVHATCSMLSTITIFKVLHNGFLLVCSNLSAPFAATVPQTKWRHNLLSECIGIHAAWIQWSFHTEKAHIIDTKHNHNTMCATMCSPEWKANHLRNITKGRKLHMQCGMVVTLIPSISWYEQWHNTCQKKQSYRKQLQYTYTFMVLMTRFLLTKSNSCTNLQGLSHTVKHREMNKHKQYWRVSFSFFNVMTIYFALKNVCS